jgi:hypothetical protein
MGDFVEQKAEGPTESVAAPAEQGSDRRAPRVAVIGVHGVAHHDPGATENAMADLLLSLPADDHGAARYYDSFRAVGIQVPLQPLLVHRAQMPAPKTWFDRMFAFLQEQSADFAYLGNHHAALREGASVARGSAGHEYMRLLLQDYEGGADGDAYVTTRLEGRRASNAPGGAAEVHVYEVLWADLARPTNTFLSFLLSLFQLILHLGSLSRLAIDSGSSENTDWKWNSFASVQRYAVRMLQIPIPLFKLILLIALFSCVPSLLKATQDGWGFPLAMGAIAGLLIAFLSRRRRTKAVTMSPRLWALRAVLPAAAGVAIAWLILTIPSANNALGAFECWLVMGAALLYYVLDKYEDVRKGVHTIGWILFGVFLAVFLGYIAWLGIAAKSVPQATLWTAEWILASLRLSWIVLFGFAFLAMMLGSVAWRSIPKSEAGRRARARAAVRTSRFALALPSLLFLLVTTLLWTGMFSIARGIQEPFFESGILSLPPGGRWMSEFLVPNPDDTRQRTDATCTPGTNPGCLKKNLARIEPLSDEAYREVSPAKGSAGQLSRVQPVPDTNTDNAKPDYLKDVLVWSVGVGFPLTLILFGLSLFLLFWWSLPSALTEKFPLHNEKEPPRASTNAASVQLGAWLSRGLDATSVITFLFWGAIFLIPAIYLFGLQRPDGLHHATVLIVESFITVATAAALALIIKYGNPVLGAILDVDTYLRTSPTHATPRAKIVERYVSLLRYIACYRGSDGRGYDSVVIVAHSLGTLISADLLRFLKAAGDPELASLGLAGEDTANQGGVSVKFLTMGSPIRQLLNRFFPYLYDWVRDEPDNGLSPLPNPVLSPPPTISPGALPDPAELGVATWVNTYRSGDYVGRSIWLDEWYRRTTGAATGGEYPEPIYSAAAGPRCEMCIGAGAHTHYWDDTAPDVAETLNWLI